MEAGGDDHQCPAVLVDAAGALDRGGETHGCGRAEHSAQHSGAVLVGDLDEAIPVGGRDPSHQRAEDEQREQVEQGQRHRESEHARASGHPDGGRHPDRGGRGQAPDHIVALEDHPGAQEADAGDHLGGDPRRVQDDFAAQQCGEPEPRDQREGARAHPDQDVGAEPGRFLAHLTFEADERAQHQGRQQRGELHRGRRREEMLEQLHRSDLLLPVPGDPAGRQRRTTSYTRDRTIRRSHGRHRGPAAGARRRAPFGILSLRPGERRVPAPFCERASRDAGSRIRSADGAPAPNPDGPAPPSHGPRAPGEISLRTARARSDPRPGRRRPRGRRRPPPCRPTRSAGTWWWPRRPSPA